MKAFLITALICAFSVTAALAQEYVSPTKPPETGKSPGVKVKLISQNDRVKTYAVIFAKGDEVVSGLAEFAEKYKVTSARFTGIGDATSAKVGWFDKSRSQFKVIPITTPGEITSLVGDIATYQGKPVVHGHLAVATEDGIVHGGHLLQAYIFPTLEVIVTVEEKPLYKRLDPETGATIIDANQ